MAVLLLAWPAELKKLFPDNMLTKKLDLVASCWLSELFQHLSVVQAD